MAADVVLMTFGDIGNTRLMHVLSMWFNQIGSDQLNEPNAMEIVRTSSTGLGGASATQESHELGNTAALFAGSIDDNGWSTAPIMTEVLGGARPFNLSTGWRWSPAPSGRPILVSLTANTYLGFRPVRASSAAITFMVGATVRLLGVP